MNHMIWQDVDEFIGMNLLKRDHGMERVLAANHAAALPAIDVSAPQGKFLNLMVRLSGARLVLEIGTLGGYSTIWMARALPRGGRLISLEYDAMHATVARENIAAAGLADTVEVRVGRAIDSLAQLQGEGLYPFDFIFIDADKPSNAAYLDWALRLSRPGTVVIVDNVIRNGAITDPLSGDRSVRGSRDAFEILGSNPRFSATALQTVGSKGYDGFAMAIVEG
ncbi:MAG TPA: O-methyltransferase [Devosia sp.]|nr:O-methyltransferase [Devosia sp.]